MATVFGFLGVAFVVLFVVAVALCGVAVIGLSLYALIVVVPVLIYQKFFKKTV